MSKRFTKNCFAIHKNRMSDFVRKTSSLRLCAKLCFCVLRKTLSLRNKTSGFVRRTLSLRFAFVYTKSWILLYSFCSVQKPYLVRGPFLLHNLYSCLVKKGLECIIRIVSVCDKPLYLGIHEHLCAYDAWAVSAIYSCA